MHTDRARKSATAIVLVTGMFWGLYWLPVRLLSEAGLHGARGTLVITFAALLVMLPLALPGWRALGRARPGALLFIALGGVAFALYSIGFVYGRVAIVILLYFLTPVWSTLIGRFVMGWPTPGLRVFAILVGLAGLALMLGADGTAPIPRSAGEWMALLAGLLWSVSSTGIRTRSDLPPIQAGFVFVAGATLASALLVPLLPVPPDGGGAVENPGRVLAVALASGALWWALTIGALMWATVRLEPVRVGILLMSEVLIGAVSAALLAGEHLHWLEICGGTLVLVAGVMEIWPARRRRG